MIFGRGADCRPSVRASRSRLHPDNFAAIERATLATLEISATLPKPGAIPTLFRPWSEAATTYFVCDSGRFDGFEAIGLYYLVDSDTIRMIRILHR